VTRAAVGAKLIGVTKPRTDAQVSTIEQMFTNRVRAVRQACSETEEFGNGGKPRKRIGYARVSTQGQSLEQQLAVLADAGCAATFGEKVSSTVPSHKREALLKALETAEEGDTLVVAKLDRLGRTQSEVVARLAELSV